MTGDQEKAWREFRDAAPSHNQPPAYEAFHAGWDAALAQRTVTTVQEAYALAVGTVLLDARGDVWRRADAGWAIAGYFGVQPLNTLGLPTRVLWTPGGEQE